MICRRNAGWLGYRVEPKRILFGTSLRAPGARDSATDGGDARMNQVFASLQQHDMRLVTLAALICILTSYAAYSLVGRGVEAGQRARVWWIGAGAFACGSGFWATHFIALLGFEPPVPVAFDISLVIASIVVAVLVAALGFAVTMMRLIGMPSFGGAIVGAG